MFRFTIHDWAMVIGAAALVVLVACTVAAIGWWRNDPWTSTGSLRRGLENVEEGTAERGQIEALKSN